VTLIHQHVGVRCGIPGLVLGLSVLLSPSPAEAQGLSGNLSSSVYVYERSDTIGVETNHARTYQTFQLSLNDKTVAIHTYGQFDTDLSTQLAGDGKFRMFQLYADWKPRGRGLGVRVGRQPVFTGGSLGSVDGIQIRVEPATVLRLRAFGGGLPPPDQKLEVVDEIRHNYALGGAIVVLPRPDVSATLSYVRRRQERPGYLATRADTLGNLFTQTIEPNDRVSDFASLDASWTPKTTIRMYGRSDLDLYDLRIRRVDASLRSDVSPRTSLHAGYVFRSPRLPWNSIFAVFDAREHHEVEAGASRRLNRLLRATAEAAGIFGEDDASFRATLGLATATAGLSYVHRGGDAGALDGVNASLVHPLRGGRITPTLQLSWASVELDAGSGDRESLFSGAGGVTVEPCRGLTLDTQVQVLRNPVYSDDVRFLARLQYRFFKNLRGRP